MNHYVYEITNNINGKKYIGKRSCSCPIEEDSYMGSGTAIKNAIKFYGIENFSKKILKICSSEEEAYYIEKKEIEEVDASNNRMYYNLTEGGIGTSSECMKNIWKDEEYRKRHSDYMKERWKDEEYREEQIERMRKISNELWDTNEHREKMKKTIKEYSNKKEVKEFRRQAVLGENNPMYGKKHTEQEKRLIGENSKKLWQQKEYREKTSNAIKKAFESEKYREKRSCLSSGENNPMYGKKQTEETKRKISESLKGKNKGEKNHQAKEIILLNTGEIFTAIVLAEEKYGIKRQSISKCCRGDRKSTGKINGEKAKWMYKNDYDYCITNNLDFYDYKKEKYKK